MQLKHERKQIMSKWLIWEAQIACMIPQAKLWTISPAHSACSRCQRERERRTPRKQITKYHKYIINMNKFHLLIFSSPKCVFHGLSKPLIGWEDFGHDELRSVGTVTGHFFAELRGPLWAKQVITAGPEPCQDLADATPCEHWSSLIIIDHVWSLLIIINHSWSFLIMFGNYWWVLIIVDHDW
jgi:hypothetical protein